MENRPERVFTADQLRGLGQKLNNAALDVNDELAQLPPELAMGSRRRDLMLSDAHEMIRVSRFLMALGKLPLEDRVISLNLPSGGDLILEVPELILSETTIPEGE